MPNFHFDLWSPDGLERDDLGLSLPSLETAYLEAARAALSISVDLLRDGKDPARYAFELRDERGRPILHVPFGEVLRTARGPARPPQAPARGRSHATIAVVNVPADRAPSPEMARPSATGYPDSGR